MWWILVYLFAALFALAVLVVSLLLATFVVQTSLYWRLKGFPYLPATFFLKSLFRSVFVTRSNGETDLDIYKYLSGRKFAGVTDLTGPCIWILDPELMRTILVKDFDHFSDRFAKGVSTIAETLRPNANLVIHCLSGQLWKDVRNVLTPAFTSGKMRRMFPSVCDCSDQLKDYFSEKAEQGEFEVKDAYGRFTMDVLASTAFGVDCNSFKNPDAPFPALANRMMSPGLFAYYKYKMETLFPRFMAFLRFIHMPMPKVREGGSEYLRGVAKEIIAEREKNISEGKDFLQLMLDARRGELQAEEAEADKFIGYNAEHDDKSKEERKALSKAVMNEPLIISQCIIFLVTGYDTSANLLGSVAYELALDQEVQDKLFAEVKRTADKHDGHITYDGLMEMEYLDQVLHEGLRKHPPGPRLFRSCTKDYQIPGTNKVIRKGTVITMPTFAIQRDERYFPNPKKFDPERFSPEEKAKRSPYVFQPFGHGPRNCLGLRFALMEAKAALAITILHFRFEPSAKTDIPLKYAFGSDVMGPKNGVWLKVEKR